LTKTNKIKIRISLKIFLLTFFTLIGTFYLSFLGIQISLPRLYRREFFLNYEELIVNLQAEISNELRLGFELYLEFEMELISDFLTEYCEFDEVENTYDCIIFDYKNIGLTFNSWIDREVHWFEIGRMFRYFQTYEAGPFLKYYSVLQQFANDYNLRVIVWEILPENEFNVAILDSVLIDIDRRGSNHLTHLHGNEVAIWQQNFYAPEFGGFAIALTGTFEPAYRVFSILNNLQQQIFIFIVAISAGISYFFSRYLSKPILSLTKISKNLTALNFDENTTITRNDELGDLSNNLNIMSFHLKRTIEKLEITNEKLVKEMAKEREQERQRRNLFTSISHELKTPITVLKGEVGGMIDGVGDFKNRDKYLMSTFKWIGILEKLVQDILTISRLEGDKLQLNTLDLNLAQLIKNVVLNLEGLAFNQSVILHTHLDDLITVRGDKILLELAFSNIISNAIYYSQSSGKVVLNTKKYDGYYEFSATNFDAHIEEEFLENIFKPFVRVDASRNSSTGGTGLGLFIVSHILDLHNYDYRIENIENGVVFTIKFPI